MATKKQKISNVPNLRFPGFETTVWEEKRLGELLEFKNGINASKEQYGRGTKFINVLDILNNDFITYENIVGRVDVEDAIAEKFAVRYGDILFQRSSETREEVGTANVYLDKERIATFGGFVIRGRKISEYEPIFFNNLLKTDKARDSITSKSGGSTRYNVGQEILTSIALHFPSLPEQSKISDLLSLIDDRITTQNKIIDSLETLIKGLSEKLFAQKLRFKDEQENDFPDWQENFGDSLFESISNKNHNSDLPILAITQEHGAIPRDMIDYNVSVSDKSIESYKVVQKGDFIISLRSFQGGIEFSNYEGICSPAYIVLRPIKEVNCNFFRLYFKTTGYIKRLTKNLEGIRDGKMISFKYFSEVTIPTPSIEEQAKITNFLFSIERKIETGRKVLAQYENQKSYLLQTMFI